MPTTTRSYTTSHKRGSDRDRSQGPRDRGSAHEGERAGFPGQDPPPRKGSDPPRWRPGRSPRCLREARARARSDTAPVPAARPDGARGRRRRDGGGWGRRRPPSAADTETGTGGDSRPPGQTARQATERVPDRGRLRSEKRVLWPHGKKPGPKDRKESRAVHDGGKKARP